MKNTSLNQRFLKAVRDKQIDVVREYVDFCSLSITDLNYQTPLHLAVVNNDVEMTRLLVNHGASLTCSDIRKRTPLHWAVENDSVEIVQILCSAEQKVNLSLVDTANMTCLRIAQERGNVAIIKILEEKSKQCAGPNLNQAELNSLAEFYKKKTFAKSNSTKHIKSVIHDNFKFGSSQNAAINIDTMSMAQAPAEPKPGTCKEFKLESDDDDSDVSSDDEDNTEKHDLSDLEERSLSKKSRLSSSPVKDSLEWFKDRSKTNFELCLTEAGKLTLDYLNKNQPVEHEQRLFMRWYDDLEKQEKRDSDKAKNSSDVAKKSSD